MKIIMGGKKKENRKGWNATILLSEYFTIYIRIACVRLAK